MMSAVNYLSYLRMLLTWWIVCSSWELRPVFAFKKHMDIKPLVLKVKEGGNASVPCDIDSYQDDSPSVIKWFKDNSSEPFYILEDTHKRGLWNANHDIIIGWAGRAIFSILVSPAILHLSSLRVNDTGEYHCLVKFYRGEQKSSGGHIIVGVEPSKPLIRDVNGTSLLQHGGPFTLGTNLTLVCLVERGIPAPDIVWYINGTKILTVNHDAEREKGAKRTFYRHLESGGESRMEWGVLERRDLFTNITCATINTMVKTWRATSTILDVSLPPLLVQIQDPREHYDALGNPSAFSCVVTGSRPIPVVSWHFQGSNKTLSSGLMDVSSDGNVSMSLLQYVLTHREHDQKLVCRAQNPAFPGLYWEHFIHLNVHYPPVASLNLGNGLDVSQISEGHDVYFECNVVSNPPLIEISWLRNGHELNKTDATVINGQYLVIRNVSFNDSGTFACVATNLVGSAPSNNLILKIQYAPRCSTNETVAIEYSSQRQKIQLGCTVDAYPADGVVFQWVVRNLTSVVPLTLFETKGVKSVATYEPSTHSEAATITCQANNSVGLMRGPPCIFSIQPKGVPPPLRNCQVTNQAADWFHVECFDRDRVTNGEHYHIEVYDADASILLRNGSTDSLSFLVKELAAATEYYALLFAVNDKGRSDPVKVVVQVIRPPSKLLTSSAKSIKWNIPSLYLIAFFLFVRANTDPTYRC